MKRSLREVLELDEKSPMDDDDFDHEVFCALYDIIPTPLEAQRFAPPVGFYFASRLLQNDVCNGGFAQAAFNIPEWFELAASGYKAMGKDRWAKIILEVKDLRPGNEEAVRQLRADEDKWEEYFGDHDFQVYDQLIMESEDWKIDAERTAYLRAHREAFKI